jgi:hypothetical protein
LRQNVIKIVGSIYFIQKPCLLNQGAGAGAGATSGARALAVTLLGAGGLGGGGGGIIGGGGGFLIAPETHVPLVIVHPSLVFNLQYLVELFHVHAAHFALSRHTSPHVPAAFVVILVKSAPLKHTSYFTLTIWRVGVEYSLQLFKESVSSIHVRQYPTLV